MMCREAITCEQITISGHSGRLSASLSYGDDQPRAVGVLLNPHPHMGGHIDNPLIRTLATHLVDAPAATLRFDYSGIGASAGARVDVGESMMAFWDTGTAPEDQRFEADAQAVARWARRELAIPVVLIGYSFGAFLAHRITDEQIVGRIFICPTLTQHAFTSAVPLSCPTTVIFSDNDFATPMNTTRQWIAASQTTTRSLCIPGANHFMRGHEPAVADECLLSIRTWLNIGATS